MSPPSYWAIDQLVFSVGAIRGLTRSSKIRFKVQGSRYFVNCFDVRVLKWHIGIIHILYLIYPGIYPRTKLEIVPLSHNIGKCNQRFLCTKNPVLYLLMKLKNFLQKISSHDKTLQWIYNLHCVSLSEKQALGFNLLVSNALFLYPLLEVLHFCISYYSNIFKVCDIMISISAWKGVHFLIYVLNHALLGHETWPSNGDRQRMYF